MIPKIPSKTRIKKMEHSELCDLIRDLAFAVKCQEELLNNFKYQLLQLETKE